MTIGGPEGNTSFQSPEHLFTKKLPLYGVECFGSSVVDPGSFARQSGLAPAPALLRYEDGKWSVTEHWAGLLRYRLAAQTPAWMMRYISDAAARVKKRLDPSSVVGTTEVMAHELCERYGALAVPSFVGELLFHVLEERVRTLLDHVGIPASEQANWLALFRYPAEETGVMKERRAFLEMAEFARTHSLDRSSRAKISRYLKSYGAFGKLAPLGRTFTFKDFMARAAQLDSPPKVALTAERKSREGALARVEEFMNATGLEAQDRDAIRAFRAVETWRVTSRELWLLLEDFQAAVGKEISKRTKFPEHLIWHLRPEELSHLLHDPSTKPDADRLEVRSKKRLDVAFVEHMVEVRWV